MEGHKISHMGTFQSVGFLSKMELSLTLSTHHDDHSSWFVHKFVTQDVPASIEYILARNQDLFDTTRVLNARSFYKEIKVYGITKFNILQMAE